jgi:alpha/beta hydrolase fold
MWAVPKRASTDRVPMCIDGGGFVSGSIYTHRKMFGHLAKATGARALLVSYHLLPEGVFPVPADDVTNAYRWLLDQRISVGRVAFAGDSVGGDRGDPHPVAAPSRCSHPAHVSVPAAARNGTSVGLSGRPGPEESRPFYRMASRSRRFGRPASGSSGRPGSRGRGERNSSPQPGALFALDD